MTRPVLGALVLALLAAPAAAPAFAQVKSSSTAYGGLQSTFGPSALPTMGMPAPAGPGFNAYGWAYAKNGGYGSSFSPTGGYGAAAGPSYNTGSGPATQTTPSYAAGFGASNGTLINPGSPSSGAGSTLGQGTTQNNATAPNAR
jgi:hypothetical protein